MRKMWHICTKERYSAIKRTIIFSTSWTDLEIIILNEVRKPNVT